MSAVSAVLTPSSRGFPASESLRLLSIDGGGVKGLTTLLILKRIMRTVKIAGSLEVEPRPCQVFDLIGGNSTGGRAPITLLLEPLRLTFCRIIAIMLGRLGMSIDDCITSYIRFGEAVFGQKPIAGNAGKLVMGTFSKSFYSISKLQNAAQTLVSERNLDKDTPFQGTAELGCRAFVCVTRKKTAKAELLRNYESIATDQENHICKVWEAASATAAASLFFESVTLKPSGVEFVDGGLRRNNPINEVIREARSIPDWRTKEVGCVVSLGTGWTDPSEVPARLDKFLKKCIDLATDSDEIADEFAKSPFGMELFSSSRYFRLSVQQGMSALQLDDWKETETMNALTTNYLGKAEISSLVERCASSLLYPPLNMLPSLLPFGLCPNFIQRKMFANALALYFAQPIKSSQSARTFVLWGLGGVGKTQIALAFALSVAHRFSILWVRVDRQENFLVDYRKILELLDPQTASTISSSDPRATLEATVRILEHRPSEWLLILDNADDLNLFRETSADGICINDHLPNAGSILLTTRDSRFVGEVSDAADGLQVRSMDQVEAETLLLTSVPPELRCQNGGSNQLLQKDITELTNELGNLPLAIVQAAANIRYLRSSLHAYVGLYKEKLHRQKLLEEPAREKRRPPQSVLLTWQISFEHVEVSDPTAAMLLCYLGFIHWENVPGALLRVLPGMEDLDAVSFPRTVAKLLHLSLLEQLGDDQFQVHPMVHYWLSARLHTSDRVEYVEKILHIMPYVFPASSEEPVQRLLCNLLLPHALETINQAGELDVISTFLSRLMQVVANYLMRIGIHNQALRLITLALYMGVQVWKQDDISLIYLRKFRGRILAAAARHTEAVAEFQKCLADVDTANTSEEEKISERHYIRRDLAAALQMCGKPAEAEILRNAFVLAGLNDRPQTLYFSHDLQTVLDKHNLCNTLIQLGKLEQAKLLAEEVLHWAYHEGEDEVTEDLLLPWVSSKAAILSQENRKEDALKIYQDVLQRALVAWEPSHPSWWISGFRVCDILFDLRRFDEIRTVAKSLLNQIESYSLDGLALDQAMKLLNLLGVSELRIGRYQEAERCFHTTLEWSRQLYDFEGVVSVTNDKISTETDPNRYTYIYNLCLTLARQGRLCEVEEIRAQNKAELEQAENEHLSIEAFLQRAHNREEIYNEAKARLLSGSLDRNGQWWIDNKESIEIVEDRLGRLDALRSPGYTSQVETEPQITPKPKRNSRMLTLRTMLDIRGSKGEAKRSTSHSLS